MQQKKVLRACLPHNYPGLGEYDEQSGTFEGEFAIFINDSMGYLKSGIAIHLGNSSISINPGTPGYGGCIKQLQNNQSDLILQLTPYALGEENLRQGNVAYEARLAIGSLHQLSQELRFDGIIDLYDSFDGMTWALIFGSIFSLTFLLWCCWLFWKRESSLECLLQIVSHCCRYGQLQCNRFVTSSVLFITASLFSFFILYFFSCTLKTDLVVRPRPILFNSYRDIMNRQARIYFINGMSHINIFNSPFAPAERKELWRYLTSTFDVDSLHLTVDKESLISVAGKLLQEDGPIIMDDVMMPMLAATICTFAKLDQQGVFALLNADRRGGNSFRFKEPFPGWYFHVASALDASKFMQAFLLSQFTSESMYQAVSSTVTRARESGFINKLMHDLKDFSLLTAQYMKDRFSIGARMRDFYERCLDPSSEDGSVNYRPFNLQNYKYLGLVCSVLLVVACVVWAGEKVHYWVSLREKLKRRKRRGPRNVLLR